MRTDYFGRNTYRRAGLNCPASLSLDKLFTKIYYKNMLRYELSKKRARNKVIEQYHIDFPEATLQEMAQMFGITRQRVFQILKREVARDK